MNEFDLIPADYRRNRQIYGDLARFGIAALAIVAVTFVAVTALSVATGRAEEKARALGGQQALIDQKSAQLQTLDEQIASMSEQFEALTGFRGGQSAPGLLVGIDRAFAGSEVWFSELVFSRAGSMVDKAEAAQSNGYFIVLPKEVESATERAWQIETHMEVLGYARNYAGLSDFVGNLLKQPEIHSVKIVRSALRKQAEVELVEFELAIIVNPKRST